MTKKKKTPTLTLKFYVPVYVEISNLDKVVADHRENWGNDIDPNSPIHVSDILNAAARTNNAIVLPNEINDPSWVYVEGSPDEYETNSYDPKHLLEGEF